MARQSILAPSRCDDVVPGARHHQLQTGRSSGFHRIFVLILRFWLVVSARAQGLYGGRAALELYSQFPLRAASTCITSLPSFHLSFILSAQLSQCLVTSGRPFCADSIAQSFSCASRGFLPCTPSRIHRYFRQPCFTSARSLFLWSLSHYSIGHAPGFARASARQGTRFMLLDVRFTRHRCVASSSSVHGVTPSSSNEL